MSDTNLCMVDVHVVSKLFSFLVLQYPKSYNESSVKSFFNGEITIV